MWWLIGIGFIVVLIAINYVIKIKKENKELKSVAVSAADFAKLVKEDPTKAKLALESSTDVEYAKRVFYKDSIRKYLVGLRAVDYHEENKINHPEKYISQNGSLVLKPEYDDEIAKYTTKWRDEDPHYQSMYELVLVTKEDAPLEQFLEAFKAGYSLCLDANDKKRPWQITESK